MSQEPTDKGEFVAMLVLPEEYAKNVNQVASVSTKSLTYVKRKELAMKPFELEYYPTEQCVSIEYKKHFAILPMIFGGFCVALFAFILLFLSDVEAGTRVPVGAMILMLIAGATLFVGPKRHRLTFKFPKKKLRWQSKSGEFKGMIPAVEKVTAYAKARGILATATK